MARKTFISYKFSDARGVRDRIIESLGNGASYYRGETSDSPNLTDLKTETIKKKLKDMIYGTSVTIVVLSPDMLDSEWIPWEIEYSLKEQKRGDVHSHANGIVAVIKKANGSYSWIKTSNLQADGCNTLSYDLDKVPDIIKENRMNQTPIVYACENCKSVDRLTGSYISFISEDDFLANPSRYIENAYSKSKKLDNYDVTKTV